MQGWSGGQHSLVRGAVALGFGLSMVQQAFAQPLLLLALPLVVMVGIGLYDRAAAALLLGLSLYLLGPTFLPSWALAPLMLVPGAPYGAWVARGRTDPAGDWHMPLLPRALAWVALALGYTLLFFQGPTPSGLAGLLLLHVVAFEPLWIRPLNPARTEQVFYDGYCGLCHGAVRMVLSEDRTGRAFRLAPLQSETFESAVNEETRATLPDSVIIRQEDGTLLTKSTGMLYILRRLGGHWRILGTLALLFPRFVRDAVYDFIAAVRHRLFAKPDNACPILPPHLRQRFDP